jgi:hypothetical protein
LAKKKQVPEHVQRYTHLAESYTAHPPKGRIEPPVSTTEMVWGHSGHPKKRSPTDVEGTIWG